MKLITKTNVLGSYRLIKNNKFTRKNSKSLLFFVETVQTLEKIMFYTISFLSLFLKLPQIIFNLKNFCQYLFS